MNRRRLVAAGCAVVVSILTTHVGYGVHATPAPILAGQLFDVRLDPRPQPEPPGSFLPCMGELQTYLTQTLFQFAFTAQNGDLAVALLPEDESGSAPGAAVVVNPVGADGSVVQFENLTAPIGFGALRLMQGRISASGAGGAADTLALSGLRGDLSEILGDQVFDCVFVGTGTGSLDRSPPMVTIAPGCPAGQTCTLLADDSVTLRFSERVRLDDLDGLLGAVDADGAAVRLLPAAHDTAGSRVVDVRGLWPLGKSVTLTLRPGLRGTAGNATPAPVTRRFTVVTGPGDLDAVGGGGNAGFENGDLAGYTVFVPDTSLQPTNTAVIAAAVATYRGVLPTEGQFMAKLSSLGCGQSQVSLTARFVVADGATSLVLDYDLTEANVDAPLASAIPAQPFLSLSLRGSQAFVQNAISRPSLTDLDFLDDQYRQSGWQQLRVPVADLVGQAVVLTLRARPSQYALPPPFGPCLQGVLLLDNLRFE